MKTAAASLLFLFALSASAFSPVPEKYNRPASERFARPVEPTYRPELGEGTLPVVLALWPGLQFGYEQDDVSLLRFGLIGSRNHNVSFFDFNLFYGRSDGAETAFQFGFFNIVDGPLSGGQLGLINVSGILANSKSSGFQIGFLGNYSSSLTGFQIGGLLNRATTGNGVQLGVVCNYSDVFRGIQIGAINLEGEDILALQLGVVNGGAKAFSGIELGMVNSSQGEFRGLQLGVANTASSVSGLQLGACNFATSVHGWQVGLFNSTHELEGVQIGLLNLASSSDWPFLPLLRVSF